MSTTTSVTATGAGSSAPSSPHIQQQYFTALCNALNNTVEVKKTLEKGKGLFSKRKYTEGDILFLESPLGTIHHSANVARVCESCKRFIGTLEDQLERVATGRLNEVQKAALGPKRALDMQKTVKAMFPKLPKGFKLPIVEDTSLTPIVPCIEGCGLEFCSEECRDTAWRRYHSMLCTGPADDEDEDEEEEEEAVGAGAAESTGTKRATSHTHHHHHDHDHDHDHAEGEDEDNNDDEEEGEEEGEEEEGVNAAALFRHQALATNEIFLLAGRMVCRVLEAWVRNGNDMEKALVPFTVLLNEPWSNLFARHEAGQEMKAEALAEEEEEDEESEDEDEEDAEEDNAERVQKLQEQIKEWVEDSATILKSLVTSRLDDFVTLVESSVASSSGGGKSSSRAAAAISPRAPSRRSLTEAESFALFSPHIYERLIGAFELNNIEMKIDSPLREYMTIIAKLPRQATTTLSTSSSSSSSTSTTTTTTSYESAIAILGPVLRQVVAARGARRDLAAAVRDAIGDGEEDANEEEEGVDRDEDDDEDDVAEDEADTIVLPADAAGGEALRIVPRHYFPVATGTALFAVQCCSNHSCLPNAALCYPSGDSRGSLVALRPIEVDEEVCINYVSVDQCLKARRGDLLHYGFTCQCERCVEEEKEEGEEEGEEEVAVKPAAKAKVSKLEGGAGRRKGGK